MKRSTFLLLLLMLFSFSSFAQNSTVNVGGTLIDLETGGPAANQLVFIVTDSLNSIGYTNSIYTDDAGQYFDSFDVPELSVGMVTVFTFDCNNENFVEELFFGPDNYDLTADFEICTQPNTGDCYADFWYSQMEDLNVEFQDFSWPNPSSWAWDFGDGATSGEQNPIHQFAEAGIYPVSLTITDNQTGCTSTMIYDVWVDDFNNDCFAWYSWHSTWEEPLGIQFEDNSFFEGGSYVWDFGDGNTSGEQSPMHIYTEEGEYEVSLTIVSADSSCVDTYSELVFVEENNVDCQADFGYYQTGGATVQFEDYSFPEPETWAWDFGDGTTSDEQNPVHQYTEDGVYPVSLTITVDETGCTSTTTWEVWVYDNNYYCQALYYWFADGSDPLTTNFFDQSFFQGDVEYLWEFGDGGYSNEQNPVYTFPEEGEYEVCLTISRPDSSCYSTFCEMVFVGNQFPSECESSFEVNLLQDLSYQFDGFMVNGTPGGEYFWDFGDGNGGFGQSTEHTYNEAGEYVVCLSTLSSNNPADTCFWVSCQMLLAGSGNEPMQASFSMMQDSANPMMMHFYDVSSGSPQGWLWEFGDGTFSDLQHPAHEFSQIANFDVCLTIYGQGMTDVYCQQIDMTNATVSVAETNSLVEKVYPNPNSGKFYVDISSSVEGPLQVQLFNFMGQSVYSTDDNVYLGGKKIEVIAPELPAGVYSLIVKSGNTQITKKIVIE